MSRPIVKIHKKVLKKSTNRPLNDNNKISSPIIFKSDTLPIIYINLTDENNKTVLITKGIIHRII